MLVLTRYPGQNILIGENIKVKVLRVSHDNVHIGIEAPGEINIVREEIRERDLANGADDKSGYES